MSTYIYSVKIFCDGNSDGKTRNVDIGFYPDYQTPANAPFLAWCESKLAGDDDNSTTTNNTLARSYAPIIADMGDIETTFEIDNPVVQNSGVDFTIANHDKVVLLLQEQSIVLNGLPIQISLNEFNSDTGALISSDIKFNGYIANTSFTETELQISCENNQYNRKSRVLNEGELLAVGETNNGTYYELKKIEPSKEIVDFGEESYSIIGRKDTTDASGHTIRAYQICFNSQPVTPMPAYSESVPEFVGLYMFVSSGDQKGEYRKILTATRIQYTDLSGDYNLYFNEHTGQNEIIRWYIEVTLEGSFSVPIEPYFTTRVQFVKFDHQYKLSKLQLYGTVDDIYVKDSNDKVSKIVNEGDPRAGVTYSRNNDPNTISIIPQNIIDDKTIMTYSFKPCSNLTIFPTGGAMDWQVNKPEEAETDLYTTLYKMNGGGLYLYNDDGQSLAVTIGSFTNTDKIGDKTMANFFNCQVTSYASSGKSIMALQFDLPSVADDFTFKNAYLGIRMRVNCTPWDTANPVKIISRKASGEAKEVFSVSLNQTLLSGGAVSGVISNIPWWYFTDGTLDTYANMFHEESLVDANNKILLAGNYKKFKLDCENVAQYRDISKIGLFFPRKASNGDFEDIKIFELCVIFEHEYDLTEVFL